MQFPIYALNVTCSEVMLGGTNHDSEPWLFANLKAGFNFLTDTIPWVLVLTGSLNKRLPEYVTFNNDMRMVADLSTAFRTSFDVVPRGYDEQPVYPGDA
ncbi:MAG TPA: hypothetical protein VGL77_08310 [Armatimonadota bacterium]|jgi:hypothetical protein